VVVSPPARLRRSRTALLPVLLLAICCVPLAAVSWWAALVLLVPLALAVWVLRAGVDVGDEEITLRSLAGSRTVPWNQVAGIRVAPRGDLWLVTTHGTELRMPALRARDLPGLAALSGGRIPQPAAAAETG
jgi:hypothetical protein